jgi:lipopolysaccharide assembly outer membrane protein LptD (OstA)
MSTIPPWSTIQLIPHRAAVGRTSAQPTSVYESSKDSGEPVTGRVTLFKRPLLRAAPIAIVCAMVAVMFDGHLLAESKREPADRVPITISADFSQAWDDPEGHIAILRGRCRIEQGTTVLQAQKMVVWRTTQSAGHGKTDRLTVYLEDDVRIEEPGST